MKILQIKIQIMSLVEAVARRTNELLKLQNMTQYRLSMLSGVPQSTISDIRHMRCKKVNAQILFDFAHAFGMEAKEFIDPSYFLYENLYD